MSESVGSPLGVTILSLIAMLLIDGIGRPAQAQISFGDEAAEPLAFSISGGISLGNYQAGVNYGLLEVFRRAGIDKSFRDRAGIPRYRLATVTGASAGNINTLLWVLEACTQTAQGNTYQRQEPDSNLFWNFWEGTGWNQLFYPKSTEPGLFSRDSLLASISKKIEARLSDKRLVRGCKVPAGITLTRVKPAQISVERIPIETQRQATLFQLEVPDTGKARFINPVYGRDSMALLRALGSRTDPAFGSLVSLADNNGNIPLASLLGAVKASSSFPFAFAPVPLRVNGEEVSQLYIDGGVFDNNPLGLTRSIFRLTAEEDSPFNTAALPVVYVNPGRTRPGETVDSQSKAPATGGLAAVAGFLPGAVATARQYELQMLARERLGLAHEGARQERKDRDLKDLNLFFSSRHFAVFGNHLHAFAGFLSRPARQYDFYVGLYDALHAVSEEYGGNTSRGATKDPKDAVRDLGVLIADSILVGQPARTVLSWLYAAEYRLELPDSNAICRIGAPNPYANATDSLGKVLAVQCAFFRALGERKDLAKSQPKVQRVCADKRVVSQALCNDGLLSVLDTIKADTTAVRILKAWGSSQACKNREATCLVEPVFLNLVGDPIAGASSVFDALIDRAVFVERLQKRSNESDFLTASVMARWVYGATYLRSRLRVDWWPNSVPRASKMRYIPVSSIGTNIGTAGSDLRYEPTLNTRNPSFVNFSAIYTLGGVRGLESGDSCWRQGCGIGFGLGTGRYFNRLEVNRLGAQVNLVRVPQLGGSQQRWAPEVEGRVVGVLGQILLSYRYCPGGSPRCGTSVEAGSPRTRSSAVAVGLADPIGLINTIWDLARK